MTKPTQHTKFLFSTCASAVLLLAFASTSTLATELKTATGEVVAEATESQEKPDKEDRQTVVSKHAASFSMAARMSSNLQLNAGIGFTDKSGTTDARAGLWYEW